MEVEKKIVEDTELKKVFNIHIPLSTIDENINERAKEKQKSYKMNGFRVGKVPVNEIIKKEKLDLFYSATDKLINNTIEDIIRENNYKIASQVDVDFKQIAIDNDIDVVATFELIPNVPSIDFSTIKIDYYKTNITEDDVNKSVEKILSSYKNWVKKDGSAENGNTVKINFVGYVDGAEFNGNRGENFSLVLGSNTFISGFEEQLIGYKSGDKVRVKTKFPDSYHVTNLAGKDTEFDVEILEVQEASNVELTDEFIKNTFGVENVDTFKNSVKNELTNTYTNMAKFKAKNTIVEELNEKVIFNLPESAVKNRIKMLKEYKQKNNTADLDEEEIKNEATKTLKCGYIFADIADKNNINISDSDLTEAIMREAHNMVGNEQMVINFYRNNQRALESLKAQLLENKVIDYLIDNISKNEIVVSVDEFNNL